MAQNIIYTDPNLNTLCAQYSDIQTDFLFQKII